MRTLPGVRALFRFPNPVNETSARVVAAGVVAQCVLVLALRQPWLLVPLAYGFVARVLTGPTLSPLGQLATRVVTPRLRFGHRLVPGPPKRFAQGIGATLSLGAALSWLAGAPGVAFVLVGAILAAATLESVAGFCLGCVLFNRLMRIGVIPAGVCAECNDLGARLGVAR